MWRIKSNLYTDQCFLEAEELKESLTERKSEINNEVDVLYTIKARILHALMELFGIGLKSTYDFLSALKIPWHKRLKKNQHGTPSNDLIFDRFTENKSQLKSNCKKISKPVWSELYSSIVKCQNNLILHDPWTILLCPILGETFVAKTNTLYTWDCENGLRLMDILTKDSIFKDLELIQIIEPVLWIGNMNSSIPRERNQ